MCLMYLLLVMRRWRLITEIPRLSRRRLRWHRM